MIGILDCVRVVAIALCAVVLALMCLTAHRVRLLKGDRFVIYATAALVLSAGFIIAQEAQQIGKPFVWWRLPWLMAVELLTLAALWRSDV